MNFGANDRLAQSIYQDLLEKINAALLAGNFSKYGSYFALPHIVETFEGRTTISTEEELEALFDGMRHRLEMTNVTGLTRDCTMAQFINEETIRGCHETRLITDQSVILNSYPALSTLLLLDGQWKVKNSQYASSNIPLPVDLKSE